MPKTPARAVLIDATKRTITSFQWDNDVESLHKLLGGYVEAVRAPGLGRDTLYVNDEGMLHPAKSFFVVQGYDQPLAGNGVIVGGERVDGDGEFIGCADAALSIDAIGRQVKFMDRADFDLWAHVNRQTPAVAIHKIDADGHVETEVLTTYGELARQSAPPKRMTRLEHHGVIERLIDKVSPGRSIQDKLRISLAGWLAGEASRTAGGRETWNEADASAAFEAMWPEI